MTIAEDLKESIKALVCHELDIVHEGDWFKDFVKGIVDERLNEIQDSEKDSDDEKGDEVGQGMDVYEGPPRIRFSHWTRTPERKSDGSIAKKYRNSNEDKYFLVQWGEGYSTNRPAVYELREIIEGEKWDLRSDFIDDLMDSITCDKLKYTDMSGDVYFHCLGNGKDHRGGLAAGIGYGRS